MYLVDLLRPRTIVELGTRKGVAYSAFCQAVQHLGIGTTCSAVDSWHGDAHTGAYGPGVLEDLRQYHDPLYGGFSRLLKTTFDEAAVGFPDATVDLLHIDGFHTYEASRHDYETWLPKMSHRGIVLMHDIQERGRDFGVWKFWEELSRSHPSFAFRHGHGLGVLGVGAQLPDAIRPIFELQGKEAEEFRRFFHQQGLRVTLTVFMNLIARLPARALPLLLRLARRPSPGSMTGS